MIEISQQSVAHEQNDQVSSIFERTNVLSVLWYYGSTEGLEDY